METRFEGPNGYVSKRLKEFYVERAKGGAGLLIVGGGSVSPEDSPKLSIYGDEYVPSLMELAKAIHAHGTKAAIQLNHGGRKTSPRSISMYPIAASSIASPGRAMPRTLTIEEIEQLEEMFAEAGNRVKKAGFDAVQIQAGHGYLVWTFLSPIANKRADSYGGSLEGRTRFLLEIIEHMKEKTGKDFPIMVRINGADYLTGGLTITDSEIIARKLEEAGVSSISVSAGERSDLCEYLVPPRAIPKGTNTKLSAKIKEVVGIPVSVAGRIDNPMLAEKILEEGAADLVEMARPLLADPELPKKTAQRKMEEIRKCIACIHCEAWLNLGLKVECTVNAQAGREWRFGIRPSPKPKKVVVVGGGPAGMEASRVARMRGHEVVLYEKDSRLGGQARLSSLLPFKNELKDLLEYYAVVLRRLGVKVKLGSEFKASHVDQIEPDVIVVATGAYPLVPRIPGVELENVVTANDILEGKASVGKNIVIIGGGLVGCETADLLTERGKKVTIIEMLRDLGMLLEKTVSWNEKLLLKRLSEKNTKIIIRSKAERITIEGVVVSRNGTQELFEADNVVLATGSLANRRLLEEIIFKGPVHEIGDCVKPRKLYDAIREGFMVGRKI
jgi:2,4-dienoyl-CoA reductase-like NADH-dependent reductase (Old Yellow Enzyme family)/thioredoxin reductase